MEKNSLSPVATRLQMSDRQREPDGTARRARHRRGIIVRVLACLALIQAASIFFTYLSSYRAPLAQRLQRLSPIQTAQALEKCRLRSLVPGPSLDFHTRDKSDRAVSGTPVMLVRNAQIWTGESNGTQVVKGDVLLENGIIKAVGHLGGLTEQDVRAMQSKGEIKVMDAKGAWVTPGYTFSISQELRKSVLMAS
jgi:hypothetical protein